MALDLYRDDWDQEEIECWVKGERLSVPNFPDYKEIYGLTGVAAGISDWHKEWPFANDMEIVKATSLWTPGSTETWYVPGDSDYESSEWRVRQFLAQYGFKPGPETFKKGFPLNGFPISRVADLEDVDSDRGYGWTVPDVITSHVMPYTLTTFTAPTTGTYNGGNAVDVRLEDIIDGLDWGFFLPWPFPRVLNAWRIWNVDDSNKWAPRGSWIAGITASGPDYLSIFPDGSVRVYAALDSARFKDDGTWGTIVCSPGETYEIQVGHVEPSTSLPYPFARIQRWESDVEGNLDWFPGDAIP